MKDQTNFDMKEYIEKRMLEIADPDERRLFKKVVGEVLFSLYEYNEKSYKALEQRILSERTLSRDRYAVYIALTELKLYDSTDSFMRPICPEDVKRTEISYQDIKSALSQKVPLKLYTIFLEESALRISSLLHQEGKLFHGIIKTEKREYRASFFVKRNRAYMDKIEELYYIFSTNYLSWSTVCAAYLNKMLDVYLYDSEPMKGKENILEIQVDFEEYSSQIRYDMIPLWNLQPLTEKTSTYPSPGIDKINFEHQIFSQRLDSGCEYLVCNTDIEITNIRRRNDDLIISCPLEQPCEWQLYQVNRRTGKEHYSYPILSNQYKDSFSGSITEIFRKSIKTKGEMARLVESFEYGNYVEFSDFYISDKASETCLLKNYNMDEFIQDEIRTENIRKALVIQFSVKDPACYLNEDIMSFLVTQIQKIFPEYLCVGELL
jgi:hypothetical protein